MAGTVYTVVIARQDAGGDIPFGDSGTEDYFYQNGSPNIGNFAAIELYDDQGGVVARFVNAITTDASYPKATVAVDDEKWTFTNMLPVDDNYDEIPLPTLDPAVCYPIEITVAG